MARVERDALGDEDLTRVFLAFTLAEAQAAEAALDTVGVSYVVTVEEVGRTLFGSVRRAAVFSVEAWQVRHSALVLTDAGLEKGLLVD
jgi:hypothetical protein